MALEAQVPVIPVGIFDTPEVMPLDAKVPRLKGRPKIEFGKPLSFDRFYDRARDRFVLRSVTDEIMYEIMMITGQEYVDEYAAKVKKQLARAENGDIQATVDLNAGAEASAAPSQEQQPTRP
jgi:1-acyl-sn-glycerol-3-phosphate acyltransferase